MRATSKTYSNNNRISQIISRTCFAFCLSLTLAACGGGQFTKLSNSELADKAWACKDNDKPSPGAAVSCGNILKECKRRREEGNYAC